MFSYYGSKSKIVKYYPEPKYDTIIEPFAGSARYSLLYCEHSVILNDIYQTIYQIWDYLINKATKEDIQSIPEITRDISTKNLNISDDIRTLMGFMVGEGRYTPGYKYSPWSFRDKEITRCKNRILKDLDCIKHWQVFCKDYTDLENIEATWFIDPPYQHGGKYYAKNKINYNELADWCLSRRGQVIVCENMKADWLPFEPLKELWGQRYTTTEAIFIKEN